uniref:Variant surface glycoprotein 1125.1082 n=1 Tax=Trypanosoma brucei TaxID=5691 RepID=A0A1J0R6D9_9TRYP|nr:variant surface glycoprotein 1125.1082 [Trypanosoma brucei]
MNNKQLALTTLMLATTALRAYGGAGDNAPAHAVLCRLARLAATPVKTPTLNEEGSATIAILEELNISTSAPAWRSLFNVESPAPSADKFPESGPALKHKQDWQPKWKKWFEAANRARLAKHGTTEAPKYKAVPSETQRIALHAQIEQLLATASAINDKLEELKQDAEQTQKSKAEKALAAALYGGTGEQKKIGVPHTLKANTNYGSSCGNSKSGLSIAGDLMCLCAANAGSVTECGHSYTSPNWSVSSTINDASWTTLLATCPIGSDHKLTASRIDAEIAHFTGALTVTKAADTNKIFIGKADAAACDGASDQICVEYTSQFTKNSKKGVDEIQWVQQLRNAAAALQKISNDATTAEGLQAQLKAIKINAEAAYTQAQSGALASEFKAANQENKPAAVNPQLTSSCEQHKSNKTTCESTGKCEWKAKDGKSETEGECKPKEGEGQTNTAVGAGEGDAGDTDKRGDAKTPEECAVVKFGMSKGKKAACK